VKIVERELSGRQKIRPARGGKDDVGGGKDRKKVVLKGADDPFGLVDPMVLGRDALELNGGLLGSEEGG
jgi:hypothetical protein